MSKPMFTLHIILLNRSSDLALRSRQSGAVFYMVTSLACISFGPKSVRRAVTSIKSSTFSVHHELDGDRPAAIMGEVSSEK
jgi:hypothetical protein